LPLIMLSLLVIMTRRMGMATSCQTISSVSANAVMRKRNRTGAMLSPWHTPTV
jgi:hypothetical protein